MLEICEIFSSIQGESSMAGWPCTFIRLSGCNLRCSYCDTAYALEPGTPMAVPGVVEAVKRAGIPLVEITGGEPLLQTEVGNLVEALLGEGYRVMIETNGSLPLKGWDSRVMWVLDVKTPGSGEEGSFLVENLACLKPSDDVKFVLSSRSDYEWAREFVRRYGLAPKCTVLFSSVPDILSYADLAEWIIRDRLPVRLNMQLHKIIWGSEARRR